MKFGSKNVTKEKKSKNMRYRISNERKKPHYESITRLLWKRSRLNQNVQILHIRFDDMFTSRS